MSVLSKIEARLEELWRERQEVMGATEEARERRSAFEAKRRELAQTVVPELREDERQLWERWDAAIDELEATIDAIKDLKADFGAALARPRRYVPKDVEGVLRQELTRRRARNRVPTDPEAEAKRRAERLREVLKKQKDAARSVLGDERQSQARIAATRDAIDRARR